MQTKISTFLVNQKYLLIIIFLNIILFSTLIIPVIVKQQLIPTDSYRDIAYAQSVLNGGSIFADPAIKGEHIWYPPLNPLLFALLSKITTIDLYSLYAWSPVYILFFIPVVFYFFLKRLFNKHTAFLAVLLIPIMPWVISHIYIRPIPSWHTFVVILLIMNYFIKSYKGGFTNKNAIIIGTAIGISFYNHTLSTLLLYGSVFLFLLAHQFLLKKKIAWKPVCFMILIPMLCWFPYLLPNLLRTKLNPEPLHFISDEILKPEFALYMPNQYTFIITLLLIAAGIFFSARRFKEDHSVLLVYCMLALTIGGQLLGYIHVLALKYPQTFGFLKDLPFLIPHEFQWNFQFFSLPLIAYACIRLYEKFCVNNYKRFFGFLLLILFLVQPYLQLPHNVTKLYDAASWTKRNEPECMKWIAQNIPPDAVCLTSNPYLAYFFIQPYTGRKIIAQFNGLVNFNIDINKRQADQDRMLKEADLITFKQLANLYEVDYAVLQTPELSAERLNFFYNNFQFLYTDPTYPFGAVVIFKINRD